MIGRWDYQSHLVGGVWSWQRDIEVHGGHSRICEIRVYIEGVAIPYIR